MSWIKRGLALTLTLTLLLALVFWWWLRGSLPLLDGTRDLPGLLAPVTLQRDAQGLLRIESERRDAIAFGLGFAHAQDRFFQMDLQRRSAAGELSELFGGRAVGADRAARLHRFRDRAERNFAQAPPAIQLLLSAYSQGINAGLAELKRPPFEYKLLGAEPDAWRPEDAYLTLFSMLLVLQDDDGRRERGRGLMRDVLPRDVYDFINQAGGAWDAPLFGAPLPAVDVPLTALQSLLPETSPALADAPSDRAALSLADRIPGSNGWAMAGQFTPHGGALVANDMHLPLGLPNTWYRAQWRDPHHGRTVSGATFPGVPFMVVGSNERVAWGFTNTQGDWSDVILLETDDSGARYMTPDGWVSFDIHEELIFVKDDSANALLIKETIWGPVIGTHHDGKLMALRWTAHDLAGANFAISQLEQADNALTPLSESHHFGMPQVHLIIGDAQGNVGWSIAGPIPARTGLDGSVPTPWHEGVRGWDGFLDGEAHPRIFNPGTGRLWTANARLLSGPLQAAVGDDGLALGARQQQIRDRLLSLEQATEADMLALQLDGEARFLQRWHARLLERLNSTTIAGTAARTAARTALENWSGQADATDVGYGLVRAYRIAALERALAPVNQIMRQHDPDFVLSRINRQLEYPGWQLLEAQPDHWLNPAFASWEALEEDALAAVLETRFADGTLSNDSWGESNRLNMSHPMASSVPVLGNWLRLPDVPMNGDTHMPRVQFPRFGASQRFAVSPGREAQAYFHMPAGQSSHPLSDFFKAGHDDWVNGRASAWLAGPSVHELQLVPAGSAGTE